MTTTLAANHNISFARQLGLAALAVLMTWALARPAHAQVTSDQLLWTSISDLHPTQFAVGYREVKLKMSELEEMSRDERRAYLSSNFVPVVIGPDGVMYLVDRHHMTRAVLEIGHKHVFVKVIQDWRSLDKETFWKSMKENNYVYLIDEKGKPRSAQEIPSSIHELPDDPFRSLAGFVQDEGGFDKTEENFAELKWASYFRRFISDKKVRKQWRESVKIAEKLAKRPEARLLPGYNGGTCRSTFSVLSKPEAKLL